MNELFGFITAVGHVTNVAKTFFQAHTEAERDAVRLEFHGAILDVEAKISDVQARYQTLLESNEQLKKQLADYDEWEKERIRYSLVSVGSGGFVYALNPDQKSHDPPHWLCPHCYSERHKSVLQYASMESGVSGKFWQCPRCKCRIIAHGWPHDLKSTPQN
jgi:hypothetical protein